MGDSTTAQGALDLLILKTLDRGANHGFGITLHIQEASDGLLRVEEGSLYPALHRLERSKLVSAEWRTSENGRRARYYKLTTGGRKRLDEAEKNWSTLSEGVGKVLRFARTPA
jgi:PadR family transcriptional regulator, regulatory protein PadR